LKAAERYRDVTLVAGPLVQQIDREDCGEEWCRLSALFGEGLRMTGKYSEALKYLKGALEASDVHLQADEKASIWLGVALCEQSLGNVDGAIAAAEEVKRHAQPESATYVQGISILAESTLQGQDRVRELTELEKRARDDGYPMVADNIALELARETDRPAEKLRLLDRVLAAKSGGYNQARAVVAKARVLRTSEEPLDLKGMDLVSLSTAYSYLHSQRFSSLFDRCHAELWRVFEAKGDVPRLLRLFRHASFVWRIRGDEAKESEYLKRLSQRDVPQAGVSTSPVVVVEVRYFLRRLKVIMIGAPSVSS
jgi:tetratricopeptide (TPR) repeat protein